MNTSRLEDFLYILVRDHLPLGAVESIMWDQVSNAQSEYCNVWLEGWAKDLAARLTTTDGPITNYNNMYRPGNDEEGTNTKVMGLAAKEYDAERPPYPVGVSVVYSEPM
jgi:hypothetical protein